MSLTHQTPVPAAGAIVGRRRFLNSAAALGVASVGLAASKENSTTTGNAAAPAPASAAPAASVAAPAAANVGGAGSAEVKPGQLDTHYGIWSGGHTGDVRILGIPSGRELHRIPCVCPDPMVGWGQTNESKAVMGTKPDGTLRYTTGDTHHVHASYKDGIYDGKYAWVNDKLNARLARMRLDYMVCDKITKLPNVQGFHGIFPDKRDPVDPAINYTTRVFCGQEFHIPLPNKGGAAANDPKQYHCLFTCVDAESMDVKWQARIDGNCDLVATSFDGKLDDPAKAVVAEVEVGLGPLHTTFDGRGNAYTTLFLDSQVCKWNIEKAIQKSAGDKTVNPIIDKIDVMYQPGHINATHAETTAADGVWMAVGNKFSKDRFLPVGPLHPENDQLLDITGEKMVLVHDTPVRGEPHDFVIFKRDWLHTKQVYDINEHPQAVKTPDEAGVTRNGNKVTVKMVSFAPAYTPAEFSVKVGDEVTLILTNIDKVEDLTHGFGLPDYNVQFLVNPQETKSVTFKVDKPGVFWYYCTNFCHALHLEMRGRMIVEG